MSKLNAASKVLIVILLISWIWSVAPSHGALAGHQEKQVPYKTLTPQKGERCIICDVPLSEKDVVLLVRGRRVPLKETMVDSFMNNSEKYFAELQPKSALFQENMNAPQGVAQGGISLGWFLFGCYVLVSLVFGGVAGYVAVSKGLPAIPNFFIGLAFNIFGVLYVFTRPVASGQEEIPAGLRKVPSTRAPVTCPKCGEKNHPSAKSCANCGVRLTPSYESEVSRAS